MTSLEETFIHLCQRYHISNMSINDFMDETITQDYERIPLGINLEDLLQKITMDNTIIPDINLFETISQNFNQIKNLFNNDTYPIYFREYILPIFLGPSPGNNIRIYVIILSNGQVIKRNLKYLDYHIVSSQLLEVFSGGPNDKLKNGIIKFIRSILPIIITSRYKYLPDDDLLQSTLTQICMANLEETHQV